MEKFENIQNPEKQEKYTSKIELSFFRHGEKENDKLKPDDDIELTEFGKKQAILKSETKEIKQSVAFGSPKARTQETAVFVMSGNQEEITGEESLEELREKLDKDFAKGSKLGVDKRLDIGSGDSEFDRVAFDHFKKGEYLKFLVDESDELSEKLGDENSFTFSKRASNVARIVNKYLRISKRWDELAQDKQKEYSDTLERFFGTHQGVSESFLAKVIENTKGVEERDKFIQALNNQGFDFTEGFNISILNHDSEDPTIHLSYKKEKDGEIVFEFNEDVSLEIIENIATNNNSEK